MRQWTLSLQEFIAIKMSLYSFRVDLNKFSYLLTSFCNAHLQLFFQAWSPVVYWWLYFLLALPLLESSGSTVSFATLWIHVLVQTILGARANWEFRVCVVQKAGRTRLVLEDSADDEISVMHPVRRCLSFASNRSILWPLKSLGFGTNPLCLLEQTNSLKVSYITYLTTLHLTSNPISHDPCIKTNKLLTSK